MTTEEKNQKTARRDRILRSVALVLLFLSAIGSVAVFSVPGLVSFSDEKAGELTADALPRFLAALFLAALLFTTDLRGGLIPKKRGLLWSLPCFLVALANFPFSALIRGSAAVRRADLLWLFLLKCAAVALMEEFFFRALLVPVVRERIKGKLRDFWTVVITAAAFGLVHLLNLIAGAGVGATFLQVGYTFLLGAMFAVLFLETGHVWLCVGVHFLFDVGGLLIRDLGQGAFQDVIFWVLTAVCGVLCAVHVIVALVRRTRRGEEKED